jgi:hypothetical protein
MPVGFMIKRHAIKKKKKYLENIVIFFLICQPEKYQQVKIIEITLEEKKAGK